MNKLETFFGSPKNGVRGLVLATLMTVSPALASDPEMGNVVNSTMAFHKKGQTHEEAKVEAFRAELRKIGEAKNNMSEQKRIWLEIARAQPAMLLENFYLVDQPFVEKTKVEACKSLAEKQPEVFVENSMDCDGLPDNMQNLEKACETLAVEKPVVFLEKAIDCTDLSNEKYFDKLKKASEKAAIADPNAAIQYSGRFDGLTWGKTVLAKAKRNLASRMPKEKLIRK